MPEDVTDTEDETSAAARRVETCRRNRRDNVEREACQNQKLEDMKAAGRRDERDAAVARWADARYAAVEGDRFLATLSLDKGAVSCRRSNRRGHRRCHECHHLPPRTSKPCHRPPQ